MAVREFNPAFRIPREELVVGGAYDCFLTLVALLLERATSRFRRKLGRGCNTGEEFAIAVTSSFCPCEVGSGRVREGLAEWPGV